MTPACAPRASRPHAIQFACSQGILPLGEAVGKHGISGNIVSDISLFEQLTGWRRSVNRNSRRGSRLEGNRARGTECRGEKRSTIVARDHCSVERREIKFSSANRHGERSIESDGEAESPPLPPPPRWCSFGNSGENAGNCLSS